MSTEARKADLMAAVPDQASRQIAEYAMALDLTSQLTQVMDETEVLDRILEIFVTLFAPERIVFWVMKDGSVAAFLTYPRSGFTPSGHLDPDRDLPGITPTGFRVPIPAREETIAIIQVDGIAFPEYRERYLSLAITMAGVCGLAISNARAHSRLESALADLKKENARNVQLSDELRVINEELEDRVRHRTSELESAMILLKEENRQRTAAEEDIRRRLDEKMIILRELHHRVRNNLQLITSIISIQVRKVSDPALQMALSETKNRIRTMSIIHDGLSTAEDLSRIDLPELVRPIPVRLVSLYRIPPGSVAINLDISREVVDINMAIPLALILNELFSNALKHAFNGTHGGAIVVNIIGEQDWLTIRFADDGIGLPAGFDWENPDTVGLMLVNSLVQQLQGTIEREPGAGTRFLIRVRKNSESRGTLRGTYNRVPE
jgi:two-component sensor histidine kinase